MKIPTRDFGEVEINEGNILTFQSPIFGFENYTRYVFLTDDSISEDFVWLQSLENPDLCFILANPELVTDRYCPEIPQAVKQQLGEEHNYMCWLMVVLKDTLQNSTINLKSPVVINPENKRAAQIILDAPLPVRHPLMQRWKGAL